MKQKTILIPILSLLVFSLTTYSLQAAEHYLLALSWQPTFCQNHSYKKICQQQTSKDYDANHFSLHGLWPQKESYCKINNHQINQDKNRRWNQLNSLELSHDTRKKLTKMMRGSKDFLHRHEWVKHGSCDGRSAEQYYQLSLNLVSQFNDSAVQTLFAANIGKKLTERQIRTAFEQSFGAGKANALSLHCRHGLIAEIRVALQRPQSVTSSFKDSISNRKKLRSNCRAGIVDAAGF